jgi:23S rRNA (adenine2030-N6)-methyltransferase
MNYRHAYHAGNFADVLKHATLALVIEHLKKKHAAFRVIDTHAGPGCYDLRAIEPNKTNEWRDGIGRLLAVNPEPDVAESLAPYFAALQVRAGDGATLLSYPGSPLVARRLLRAGDRLIANELHPEDAQHLARLFAGDRQVKVSTLDGWTALKAYLPPKERRGVVLIDPPFEQPGDLDRLATGLAEALRRFATGTVILWFPIKATSQIDTFKQHLASSCERPALSVELLLRPRSAPETLNGTGLVVVNPPHTLPGKLERLLPFLCDTLGRSAGASWGLEWIRAEEQRKAAAQSSELT